MRLAFAIGCLFPVVTVAFGASPVLTAMEPIPLTSGVNPVANLAPDGRNGLIVLGWRDNGNAHGYDLALVLVQDKPGAPFDIVDVDVPGDAQWTDGVVDDPHMGIDMVRVFRFVRARVDGKPSVLLLLATREPGESIPSPSRVAFEVYVLEHAPDVGTTPYHFRLLTKERSEEAYCNADMAMSKRYRLALRESYVGPRTANGCP